ncbi:MAG: phosphatidate cytidylyltransferase, partial [Bacteroidetes bacterium]|nr:phosphatidate cytidylyltransferase [Bacteroidota bacterium]
MPLSNIQLRAITGAVFVLVMITSVQFQIPLAALSVIIFAISSYELGTIFKVPPMITLGYTAVGVSILTMITLNNLNLLPPIENIKNATSFDLSMEIAGGILLITIIARNWMSNQQSLWMMLGSIYILTGCIALFQVGSMKQSAKILDGSFLNRAIFVLIITWSNDVFAYLVGRKIGKTPLAKSISPNKTIEGTVAGLFFAGIAASICMFIENGQFNYTYIFIGIGVGIAATVGDLIESKAKRIAGVKDSGNILPGHGGFLDRFDAMFLTMPIYWLLTL